MRASDQLFMRMLWAVPLLFAAGVSEAVELNCDPAVAFATFPNTVVVSVMATDLVESRGYALEIEFDPELVDFLAAARGELYGDYTPPFGLYWSVTEGAGLLNVECFIIPEDECVTGAGEILRLTFAALPAQGEFPLHFTAGTLRDCAGAPILPLTMHDGWVVIGPEASLFFDPDPKYVWGPEPFDVSLSVGPVDSLRGFQIYFSYDPAVVSFDSALVGGLLEGTGYPYWWYVREESEALVRVEGVLLGDGLFATGPGELIDLHFTALSDPDTTQIVFETWHVWDVHAVEMLPVVVDDGLVIINEALQDVAADRMPRGASAGLALQQMGQQPGPGAAFACVIGGQIADVNADVLDINGRWVTSLVPESGGSRRVRLVWDGCTATGGLAAPGVYYLRVRSGGESAVGKVVIVR